MRSAKRIIEPLLTIEDLDAMPEDDNRYELIEGEIIMSRSPSIAHQVALQNIQFKILLYLTENPIGLLLPGIGVIFDDFNGVIPDLVFISHERRDEVASGERIYGMPDLAVEIVSPGAENDRRDRNVKKQLYGMHGVKEYWVVDPENRTLEVFKLKRRKLDLVATFNSDDELTSSVLKGFRLKVNEVFQF